MWKKKQKAFEAPVNNNPPIQNTLPILPLIDSIEQQKNDDIEPISKKLRLEDHEGITTSDTGDLINSSNSLLKNNDETLEQIELVNNQLKDDNLNEELARHNLEKLNPLSSNENSIISSIASAAVASSLPSNLQSNLPPNLPSNLPSNIPSNLSTNMNMVMNLNNNNANNNSLNNNNLINTSAPKKSNFREGSRQTVGKFFTVGVFQKKQEVQERIVGHSYNNQFSCHRNAVHCCTIHTDEKSNPCPHQFRICERLDVDTNTPYYELQERGVHFTKMKLEKKRGVHPLMKKDVDDLLMAGITPSSIIKILKRKFLNNDDLLALIPKKSQIVSRKITAKTKEKEKKEREANGEISARESNRFYECQSVEEIAQYVINNPPPGYLHSDEIPVSSSSSISASHTNPLVNNPSHSPISNNLSQNTLSHLSLPILGLDSTSQPTLKPSHQLNQPIDSDSESDSGYKV